MLNEITYNVLTILLFIAAFALAFGPMIYGISKCLHNNRLSSGMKILWCLGFVFYSFLALICYLAIYGKDEPDCDCDCD